MKETMKQTANKNITDKAINNQQNDYKSIQLEKVTIQRDEGNDGNSPLLSKGGVDLRNRIHCIVA